MAKVKTGKSKKKVKKRFLIRIFHQLFLVVLILHIFILSLGAVAAVICKHWDLPSSSFMIYRRIFNGQDHIKRTVVPLSDIPVVAGKMVVCIEDYKFYQHHGIDTEAIITAYRKNAKAGYRKFGGSTITQQLVRTLFLVPDKLMVRKYVEVLLALELDFLVDKERILELYLNNVEWGNGIFGIEAAAQYYFKQHVKELKSDDIAQLVSILPSPLRYSPHNFKTDKRLLQRYEALKGYFLQ